MSTTEKSQLKRILVVEDNDFIRTQIARYLKAESYDVVEAADGNEALEKLDKAVHLVIVDVRMEPMGGFDFINIIQGSGYTIPVVLVTGDQNSDLLERAGQYKVSSVLLKPVKKERLLTMVSRLLTREG
ncbi:MAG: response regulator [Pseudomonadota bacterium]